MLTTISDAAAAVDRELSEVAASFDYLLYVSPTNSTDAWARFSASSERRAPEFTYRDIGVDVDDLRRRLDATPIRHVDDPAIARMLDGKRLELDRYLGLLASRGSSEFLQYSLALSGAVDDELSHLAEAVLEAVVETGAVPEPDRPRVTPQAWAERAEEEIQAYRQQDPAMRGTVHLREDIGSLMVSGSEVLVPRRRRVAVDRVEALIHHEVGVHLLTWWNGTCQPLRTLADGLGGYVEAQEGLGVLAEWLVDGLSADRLQVLAARVLAARSVSEGAAFLDTFAELHDERGVPAAQAFDISERVHRGGGLVKDAEYLRGVVRIMRRIQGGGSLEPLLVGKPSLDDLDDVEALLARRVLVPPRLRPRWLDGIGVQRLELLRSGDDPAALLLR